MSSPADRRVGKRTARRASSPRCSRPRHRGQGSNYALDHDATICSRARLASQRIQSFLDADHRGFPVHATADADVRRSTNMPRCRHRADRQAHEQGADQAVLGAPSRTSGHVLPGVHRGSSRRRELGIVPLGTLPQRNLVHQFPYETTLDSTSGSHDYASLFFDPGARSWSKRRRRLSDIDHIVGTRFGIYQDGPRRDTGDQPDAELLPNAKAPGAERLVAARSRARSTTSRGFTADRLGQELDALSYHFSGWEEESRVASGPSPAARSPWAASRSVQAVDAPRRRNSH